MRVTISAIIITIAACFISQVVSDLGRSGEPSPHTTRSVATCRFR